MKKRQLLSIILSVFLLSALLPTAAFAATVPDNPAGTTVPALASGDYMDINNGTITTNNGTLTDNFGTVTYNTGTVTYNTVTLTVAAIPKTGVNRDTGLLITLALISGAVLVTALPGKKKEG